MGIYTYVPQSAPVTPDQGGTLAVTGAVADGHGSTVTSCQSVDTGPTPPDNDSQAKSCRWSGFAAGPGNVTSEKLKFSWTASGSVSVTQDVAGSGSASIQFVVEYSIDNGSNWTTKVSKSKSVSGANVSGSLDAPLSGSEEVALSPGQDITLVQVRTRTDANTSATAPTGGQVTSDAGITTTVSAIKIEVQTVDQPIVMM